MASIPVRNEIGHETSTEKLIEIYNIWCKTYDVDAIESFGYGDFVSRSTEVLSAKLKELGFPLADVHILDLGAGTGLVGQALHKLGYQNIDALDFSPGCLKAAKEKGVYKNLIRGCMASDNSQDLGVKGKEYDAAICLGVFTLGHVRGKGFDDVIHVVKPGGLACFSIRGDVIDDPKYYYNEKMEELCHEKKWKLLSKVHTMYRPKDNINAWLYIYQVLPEN